jgi:hypothetical protein
LRASKLRLLALAALLAAGFGAAAPFTARAGLTWIAGVVSHDVQARPRVVSVTPQVSGVTVRFNERVRAAKAAFGLACPTGHPHVFTLRATLADVFVLGTKATPLKVGSTCTLVVRAADVHNLAKPPRTLEKTYTAKLRIEAPLTPPKVPAASTTTRPTITTTPAPVVTPAPVPTVTTTTTTSGGGGGGGGGGGSVNHAPTDVTLSKTLVPENEAPGFPVGTLGVVDADPDGGAGGSFALVSSAGCPGAGDSAFTVDGASLETAVSLDFEQKASYAICIRATDSGGLSVDKAFTITVADVNDPPATLTLSNATVKENLAANTLVGTFSATDPDAGQTVTFALVGGAGSADNVSFTLTDKELRTKASFDFEAKSSYSIRVRATDNGSPPQSLEQVFTISVLDVNEPPTQVKLSPASVAEHQKAGTVVGTLTSVDPDAGDTGSFQLVSTAQCPGTANGDFAIAAGELRTATTFDVLDPQPYPICVRVTDRGGFSVDQQLAVGVTDVNDPPVLAGDTLQPWPEDGGALTVPAATLLGNDSPGPSNESSQTLTITAVQNVTGGTAGVVAGNVVFTPLPDYNGPASFDYVATDNGTTSGAADPKGGTAHVTFTITEVNDPPARS